MVFKAKSLKSLRSKFNLDTVLEPLPWWIPPLLLGRCLEFGWVRLEVSPLQRADYLCNIYIFTSTECPPKSKLLVWNYRLSMLLPGHPYLWGGEAEHGARVRAAHARSSQNQWVTRPRVQLASPRHTCSAPGQGAPRSPVAPHAPRVSVVRRPSTVLGMLVS